MASPVDWQNLETIVWRIADKRHPIFDGMGAARQGGRWNSPGFPVIYTSLSYAACLLEQLARCGIGTVPHNLRWIKITIPKGIFIEEISLLEISKWKTGEYEKSKAFGDRWIKERRSVALIVPSAVAYPNERNVLINPSHPDFASITYSSSQKVEWDVRFANTLPILDS